MTITPGIHEQHRDHEVASGHQDVVALIQALRHTSELLSDVRASAFAASTRPPAAGPVATNENGVLDTLDAEAERLRMLLERRPLEAGCDAVHDDMADIAVPAAQPDPLADALDAADQPAAFADGHHRRNLGLLTHLDALDAESAEVLEALRAPGRPENALRRADAPAAAAPTPRTFQTGMRGDDIRAWQRRVNRQLVEWRINYALDVDGDYAEKSLLWSKRVLYGLGITIDPSHGVTLEARIKARHPESRTPAERSAARDRRNWLRRLRKRYSRVHTPVTTIIASSHGYSSAHDGIDLICPAEAPIFAVCRARVIDVRSGGWWGLNPKGNVSLGDGIIQLEALTSTGPLRKGMHIGYGHAEHARVKVGQVVKPGDVLGRAGFANAWHVHFMLNDGSTTRGIGNIDPRSCLNLFTGRTSR